MRYFETTPSRMIDQLRTWFFAKDRSLVLADGNRSYLMDSITRLGPTGAWTLISETELTASAASVTFSNIPQIFRTLALVVQARSDRVAESDGVIIQFNGDTGANYDYNVIRANNDTATAVTLRAESDLQVLMEGANALASAFAPSTITIPNYANTLVDKWILALTSQFGDVSADSDLRSDYRAGRWRNTSAITSIALTPSLGVNFVANSIFQLYGIL